MPDARADNTSRTSDRRLLLLAPPDNVAVAAVTIEPGACLCVGNLEITAVDRIGRGHKIALHGLRPGEKVIKFGTAIGSTTRDVAPGEHVHTHNLQSDYIPIVTYRDHDPQAEPAS